MQAAPDAKTIREMAEARVAFRRHALAYVLINAMMVVIWFLTSGPRGIWSYWPIWVHMGWGIGLAFNAYAAYAQPSDAVAREEEKLRQRYAADDVSPKRPDA